MKIMYILLLFFNAENTAQSEATAQKKSQLKRKKKRTDDKIKYIQDRMLYQKANAEEPAQLYSSLQERKQINAVLKKLSNGE